MSFNPDDILVEYGTDTLCHYGIKRRSGRYPWGSGDNPYQHSGDWLARVEELRKDGMKEADIAEYFKLGTVEYRAMNAIAGRERKLEQGKLIKELQKEGLTNGQIAEKLGFPNESSVRSKASWYDRQMAPEKDAARNTAEYLKAAIDELGGAIDVGEGVNRKLNISQEKLDQALVILQNEGYTKQVEQIDRVTDPNSDKKITVTVIGKGDLGNQFIKNHPDQIHSLNEYGHILTEDGEKTRPSFVFPESLDSKRLAIVYAEDGGKDRDGLIEIRPGVQDLSLGESNYAQVRILVDGNKYLKGMAVYNADLPEGVDVRFNTNKTKDKPLEKVLKPVKEDPEHPGQPDPENPFGSLIKEKGGQTYYDDPNGKYVDPKTGNKQSLSLINKRADAGDWGDWADKVPSQFLSKQSQSLINRQLKYSIDERNLEYAEILSINNPTIKKDMLLKFADSCETNAVTLKAAAFPGQKYQVIIPLKDIKDTEVYAPNYEHGSQVALIRYPHGGTFEIPILTVNNNVKEGKAILGTSPKDAVGINSAVAERLSGADFDGDTVQVIPLSDRVSIKSTHPLPGLVGFDPKVTYAEREGMTYMRREVKDHETGRIKVIDNTQKQMGEISNLITDMTILGAPREDLAKAVRHSMVVIDAGKHKLDYKRSEIDNEIKQLKKTYQGRFDPETGRIKTPAATIISRASGQASTPRTVGAGKIDPETGKMIYRLDDRPKYKKVGDQYVVQTDKDGNPILRSRQSKQMAITDDAFTLVSNMENPVEVAYAKYANTLKDMAKKARLESLTIVETKRSPSAAQTYAAEVASLKSKLNDAQANQDVERWAQIIATSRVKAKREADPSLETDKKMLKKVRQQTLTRAREEVGAKRHKVVFTDKEWEAIQAGAIGHTTLASLLKYADPDKVKERAMPRNSSGFTRTQIETMKLMVKNGYTQAQIADKYGVSSSRINDLIRGKE